jgi:hypothetical protein
VQSRDTPEDAVILVGIELGIVWLIGFDKLLYKCDAVLRVHIIIECAVYDEVLA